MDGAPPVFVGGAPRSGTHVVAHLIGAHPRYYVIPYEVTAHCDRRRGIPAYLAGSITRDELIEELRTFWWRRQALATRADLERGLFKLLERARLEALLARFDSCPDDPLSAARMLAAGLFAEITARSGRPGFAEHSPENLVAAPQVAALFPDAKFIHVVRDGRDRACSVVSLPFGADTHAEAMRRWGLVLKRGERVRAELPVDRFLELQLEDLVLADRERSYARLLEFLELPEDPAMRAFFESEVGPERAHVGRWRTELEPAQRAELEAAYAETVAELRADGVTSIPPERSLEVAYRVSDGRSSVDPWVEGRGGEDI
jgi:hypothetical protein